MFRIRELKKYLPVNVNGYTLRLMNHRDLDWYIDNIKSDYFIRYMDNKAIKNMSDKEISFKLSSLIVSYNMNLKVTGEARLVLEDELNNKCIAGCTIFEIGKNIIELGYWVTPAYQNKGIAKSIIKQTNEIIKNLSNIEEIRLEIQSSNIWSIKVAEDCGYTFKENKKGAYDINKIYHMII